jgi:signal transduction histidine kinase
MACPASRSGRSRAESSRSRRGADEVSTRKDYSVRARGPGHDELGTLGHHLQPDAGRDPGRNRELEQARGDLERRVEARTRDLAAANKELEAFSYSVSHDLRAHPCARSTGSARCCSTGYAKALDDRGRHYLDRVRAATQRMSELIDDLLGLARVGRRELARREVDVSAPGRDAWPRSWRGATPNARCASRSPWHVRPRRSPAPDASCSRT